MQRFLISAGIALLLVGCRPATPKLTYETTSFTPLSFQEVKATIQGTISNDNLFPLTGKISYTAKLNDQTILSGESEELSIGSQQTVPFALNTTINVVQAYGSLKNLLEKIGAGATDVPFSLEGEYSTQTMLGIPLKAPLKTTGRLPLPKLPQFSLTNITVKNLSLSQLTLRISAQITNNNPTPINIQKFAYQLMGNNTAIVSSAFSGEMFVLPNTTADVDWDLVVNLKNIDSATVKQLLDGSLHPSLTHGIEDIQ